MKRAYKYKIRPTVKQQRMLSQFFGCARFIYNWGLDRKVKEYKEERKNVTYLQLAKELTLLKRTEEHKWLNDCASDALQQSLRCLDNAYTQSLVATENKIPQGSGILDGEGNVIGHPMKRQYSKSSLSGTTGI